ncbi:MAG TPA: hypothetical protein VJ696_06870 [Rhodanobacteraceae bacterium]|nr:hypothetical protein [Rhodanobacteraceae bacterium]
MEYLKVRWVHRHSSDPVLLMSELDSDRYEARKIEVFADGRMGFAGPDQASDDTVLGERPVPPMTEIATDPQFVVEAFDGRVFEDAWRAALGGGRWKF